MLVRSDGVIVEPGYHDWAGTWRAANPDTLRLVRDVVDDDPPNATAYDAANATRGGACVLPGARRVGIAVQVYSLWSEHSAGFGDLGDVATLAAECDAGFLLLSPLHAPLPTVPQEPSPYFPSSRQYRNPLHLRVGGVTLPNDPSERIDRDAVWHAKLAALEKEWAAFRGDAAFDAYCRREGDDLVAYATFCAQREDTGTHDRVRFHQWVQWRIDDQLRAAATAGAGLVHDIAVGFNPSGADASMWREALAPGFSVGAPPDEFNRDGQDWGLPPFVPDRLSACGHRPIVAALESAASRGAGIRIDHVMGLFRLFWVPEGGSPADGVYVRYPAVELLDIVADVSRRHNVFVVGEDLGTVDPEARAALMARNVLSYKVLFFEDTPPSQWPECSLASATTHDLPTIVGRGHSVDEVHAQLLAARSALVVLTAEDLLHVREQPNRPGVDDPWNWSRRLPVSVAQLAQAFSDR